MSAAPAHAPVPFAAGDVIEVDAEHYNYGTERLRLRVEEILRRFGNGWIEVHGVEIHWTGADGDQRFAAVDPAHVRVTKRARRVA
ncbi:hypothetical protein [Plantactinospora sp. WMMB782]|uniref:hypothetical protein n=1 Tax=Plantactinospora sp. WMMB782 TaxID=3404121 RepID=UPI003B945460